MIHHVALETRRAGVEAAVAFYALLGFERVTPPDGLLDVAAWVQRGDQQIHLLFADEPVVAPQGHVAVVCADFEAAVGRLRAAGHRVEERERHWGSPRVFTRDPTGHRVELMRFPPP